MLQGLSSRKVGATTVNSKSSRSHIVFTFVIETWCKVQLNLDFLPPQSRQELIEDLFLLGVSQSGLVQVHDQSDHMDI